MIVYGSKSKQLAKEILTDKCPNCGSQNSIDMHVFQKYAHVFWIPFFPMGKTGVSQCDHCKQVLKLKEMPPALRESYENLKTQTKTPIWTFSGLAVLLLLVAGIIVSEKKKDEKNATIILTPRVGDIFEIKTETAQYTIYKVAQIEGDSVFVRTSNYETNKITGIDDLKAKGDSTYSEGVLGFSKSELKEMLTRGEIIDIDRK